jgi:hypothetical protein
VQQRAEDSHAVDGHVARNAAEASETRAAEEALGDGLGVIVCVVGEEDAGEVVGLDDVAVEAVAEEAEVCRSCGSSCEL